ncbi:lysozyme [Dyella kyungheensis]|uniref:lysozyme n=1 Tax=Dyella kyungheensis TaxID=1242174 RepID=UPI003CF07976
MAANARLIGGAAALIAAALVAKYEPAPDQFKPYWDPYGNVWTVCDGHTGGVDPNRIYTADECKAFKQADIATAQGIVNQCLPMPKLPQIEGALTDATYNIGRSVVCGSTLQKAALANDWPAACAELTRWDKAGGRVLPGLTRRRTDDRAVCEGRAVLDMWAKQ